MADLKFTIDADYQQASKAFRELANESEATREKIEKFSDSFKSEQIDKFIDKQKLLEASLTGTRGEVAAMTGAQKNYEKEIEKLIRSGLDPESNAIQRLRNEHDALGKKIKETNEVQKAQEQLMKGAEKAALGFFAAMGAGVAAVGIATQKMAEAGNQFAKTARVIGMTAETFQELDYAAKMSGVNNLKGSLEKLNKSVADVKGGTGTLTNYLKENDKQLLDQLKNVKSNEEAFDLLMDAIGKAPDEFSRAQLAQAAFGKSGQEMILLANEGADGIAKLREEARKYGVISNEAAANSEAYLDAQSRLKAALGGVSNELTAKLLPGLTETITKMANFIAGIDNWEDILTVAGIALTGTTAALTAFVIASKGAAVVEKMGIAIKAFQAAVMGPAGAAALAIGVLTAAIMGLIAWQNKQENQGKEIAEGITNQRNEALNLLNTYQQLNPEKEIDRATTDKLISIYPALTEEMVKNAKSIDDLKNKVKELSEEEAKAQAKKYVEKMADMYDGYVKAVETANQETTRSTTVEQYRQKALARSIVDNFERTKKNANDILGSIGLEVDISNNFQFVENAATRTQRALAEAEEEAKKSAENMRLSTEEELKKLSQRLSEINLSPEQQFNEQVNQIKSFLVQRAELERTSGEERIKSYQEQSAMLLNSDKIRESERASVIKASEEAIAEYRKQINEESIADTEEKNNREKEQINTLIEQLNQIPLTEQQIQTQRIEQFKSYLEQRMELQLTDDETNLERFEEYKQSELELEIEKGEERIAWLEGQKQKILENMQMEENEKLALLKSFNALQEKEEKSVSNAKIAIKKKEVSAMLGFADSISSALKAVGQDNVGVAILSKAIASAQALINSYLAFTETLADPTIPSTIARMAMAGTVLASGLAQQAAIWATPIPSAETGGRFIVPHSVGSDGSLMRVNSDEEVEVTPRGMTGYNKAQNIIVQIEKQTIFDVMNEGIRSGDVLIAAVNY